MMVKVEGTRKKAPETSEFHDGIVLMQTHLGYGRRSPRSIASSLLRHQAGEDRAQTAGVLVPLGFRKTMIML